MPLFYTRTTNSGFDDRDDGADYDRPEAALALGVTGALGIAADEVQHGKRTAAVVVCVERPDGTPVLRSVVAVSVSPLMTLDIPLRLVPNVR